MNDAGTATAAQGNFFQQRSSNILKLPTTGFAHIPFGAHIPFHYSCKTGMLACISHHNVQQRPRKDKGGYSNQPGILHNEY